MFPCLEELMEDEAMLAELEADELKAGKIPVDQPYPAPEQEPAPVARRQSRKRTRNPADHQVNRRARAYNTGRRRVSGESVRARRPGDMQASLL